MMDPRTTDILAPLLAGGPAGRLEDPRALDRQLLHGPDALRPRRRPPLDAVDMAISFDRIDHPKHYRLSLYVPHAYDHAREAATP